MIATELLCLLLIGYFSLSVLTWASDNMAAFIELVFIGPPAWLVQIAAMVQALVGTDSLPGGRLEKRLYRWVAIIPAGLSTVLLACVFGPWLAA